VAVLGLRLWSGVPGGRSDVVRGLRMSAPPCCWSLPLRAACASSQLPLPLPAPAAVLSCGSSQLMTSVKSGGCRRRPQQQPGGSAC
jgi:hypothetical protein